MQISGTHSGRPRESHDDGLHSHSFGGQEKGNYEGMARSTSAYTAAAMHPVLAGVLGLGATLALGALVKRPREVPRTNNRRQGSPGPLP